MLKVSKCKNTLVMLKVSKCKNALIMFKNASFSKVKPIINIKTNIQKDNFSYLPNFKE